MGGGLISPLALEAVIIRTYIPSARARFMELSPGRSFLSAFPSGSFRKHVSGVRVLLPFKEFPNNYFCSNACMIGIFSSLGVDGTSSDCSIVPSSLPRHSPSSSPPPNFRKTYYILKLCLFIS